MLLPPLHTKLGLLKQFVKMLDKNDYSTVYICNIFTAFMYEKEKQGFHWAPEWIVGF